MTAYRISSRDGTDFGTYQGDTPSDAFLAMIRDGGRDKPDETTGTVDDWHIEQVLR